MMRWTVLFYLTALGAGANTCFTATAHAQTPQITVPAAKSFAAEWMQRDSVNQFACLYGRRNMDAVVTVDSVGPLIPASPSACAGASGVIRYTDGPVDMNREFLVLGAAMDQHPQWIVVGDVWRGHAFLVTRRVVPSPYSVT